MVDFVWFKENLRKNIGRRIFVWIAWLFLTIFIIRLTIAFEIKVFLILGYTLILIGVDEYIKEGYWFDREDLKNKNPIEHEDITIFTIIIGFLILIYKKFVGDRNEG